jgi:hypothetical protein
MFLPSLQYFLLPQPQPSPQPTFHLLSINKPFKQLVQIPSLYQIQITNMFYILMRFCNFSPS